jgi:hypothetical protein
VPNYVLFYPETDGRVEIVGDIFNSFVVGGELDVNPLLFFRMSCVVFMEVPLIEKKGVAHGLETARHDQGLKRHVKCVPMRLQRK